MGEQSDKANMQVERLVSALERMAQSTDKVHEDLTKLNATMDQVMKLTASESVLTRLATGAISKALGR